MLTTNEQAKNLMKESDSPADILIENLKDFIRIEEKYMNLADINEVKRINFWKSVLDEMIKLNQEGEKNDR